MPLAREPPKKERIYPIYVSRSGLKRYIRWESTPAGLQRCTEEVCHALYARISQQECRGILDFESVELIIKTALINKVRSLFCIWKVAVDYEKLSIRIIG